MSLPSVRPQTPMASLLPASRRGRGLNLSHRPFVNTRPVTRLSALLWLLGGLLLFGNVSLFWSYLSGSAQKRADLERLEQDVQRQQQSVSQLEQKLAQLDLEQQNKQVQYLNLKIGERVFSWSLLFDRFAQVLPNDVRLLRLTPRVLRKKGRGAEEEGPADGRVQLGFQVESKSDEAFFDFVNRMFEHDAFENPDFSRESREENEDVLAFEVQVTYFPNRQSAPPAGGAGQ